VIKVSSDHRATVLFQTSKSDVNIKLNILDHEKEVASSQGKGHVTLPVYCFLANNGLYTHTHTHTHAYAHTHTHYGVGKINCTFLKSLILTNYAFI